MGGKISLQAAEKAGFHPADLPLPRPNQLVRPHHVRHDFSRRRLWLEAGSMACLSEVSFLASAMLNKWQQPLSIMAT
jgi:hypothetical protein